MISKSSVSPKANVYKSDSHPKFNHLYELLSASCPPGYMEQMGQIQCLNKRSAELCPQIVEIIPGLYLGNQDAAWDAQTIQKYNVKSICSCGHYFDSRFQGVDYKRFLIEDSEKEDIKQYFDEFIKWASAKLERPGNQKQENLRGNVLVHCRAGVSRSATLVIAYLIGRKGMSFEQAFKHVKRCRNEISPNPGFLNQLKLYQQQRVNDNEG